MSRGWGWKFFGHDSREGIKSKKKKPKKKTRKALREGYRRYKWKTDWGEWGKGTIKNKTHRTMEKRPGPTRVIKAAKMGETWGVGKVGRSGHGK